MLDEGFFISYIAFVVCVVFIVQGQSNKYAFYLLMQF